MFLNPTPTARPRRSAGLTSRRRRRGSILIFVVALLTLVALIGTALIATARIDRYTTRAHVTSAELDATRNRFITEVKAQVEDALTAANDFSPTVDGPLHDPWLADRLPEAHPSDPTRPVWRHVTGRIVTGQNLGNANAVPAINALNTGRPNSFVPPRPPVPSAQTANPSPSTADSSGPAGSPLIRTTIQTGAGTNNFLAAPVSLSVTYPNSTNYPVENLRGKTRTFPALEFLNANGSTSYGTYLAGDADGDGIADSVLYQLTATPVDGVTYYAAVRIIDNNSAINVNTAWSRDNNNPTYPAAGSFPAPVAPVHTFFPTNVGLQEMLSRRPDPVSAREDRFNEMVELMEYRLGYNTAAGASNPDAGGWSDAFNDYTTGRSGPEVRPMYAASNFFAGSANRPVEDPEPDTTPVNFGNNNTPTPRNDFHFASQSEALHMQLGRRLTNPGFNMDSTYRPEFSQYVPSPTTGSPFPYRSFAAADAGALAYRFMMVNPDAIPTELELRLRMSAYASAPNYTDPTTNTGAGFLSETVAEWRAFPANEYRLWFQFLNFDPNPAAATSMNALNNTLFQPNAATLNSTGNTSAGTANQPQFRSVRPLLTTHNPTGNLIPPSIRWSNTLYTWSSGVNSTNLLYPGMISWDMTNETPAAYNSATRYRMFDMVYNDQTRLFYMRVSDTSTIANPWDSAVGGANYGYRFWEPQPYVTGFAKTNVNLAGFPELWRSFFAVMTTGMTDGASLVGGTPFDELFRTDAANAPTVQAAFYPATLDPTTERVYDIYRGMRWTEDYGAPLTPTGNGAPADPQFDPYADPLGGYEQNPLRMFRSPVRDPRPATAANVTAGLHRLTPQQVMALRSALAANNVKQMLSKSLAPVVRTITLYDVDPATPNPPAGPAGSPGAPVPQYEVTLFGAAPQPFITEVFASNDTFGYQHHQDSTDPASPIDATYENPNGYVAIELYNPYGTALDLGGYKIYRVNRIPTAYTDSGLNATPGASTVEELYQFPGGTTLTAGAYMVIETHGDDAPPGGMYRPRAVGNIAGGLHAPVPALSAVIGLGSTVGGPAGELVLVRPRVLGQTGQPFEDMVPVDQFDFSGFGAGNPGGSFCSWHYARNTSSADWQWVYPGRYDGGQNEPTTLGSAAPTRPAGMPRQEGTHRTPIGVPATAGSPPTPALHYYAPVNPAPAGPLPSGGEFDPWIDIPSLTANATDIEGQHWKDMMDMAGWTIARTVVKNPPVTLGAPNGRSTYESIGTGALVNKVSIQLPGLNTPGHNPVAAGGNLFPFGGFARNGDILQVPYIGAYRIRRLEPSTGLPPNSIDPGTLADAPTEIIEMNSITMDATFAEDTDPNNNTHNPGNVIFSQENVGRFTPNFVHYDWAADLFEYLTVNTPSVDFLPNTDPHAYTPGITTPADQPQPVANQTAGTANATNSTTNEDSAPVQGLININTAPAKVLSMLPLAITPGTGMIDEPATDTIARDIVVHRNGTGGEFRSMFKLGDVPAFRNYLTNTFLTSEPGINAGDLSGVAPGTPDGVRYDFEEQYLLLNRISNLITTRSDSFTVYIVVQGWREAGTTYPALDWEKRAAFILDRSSGQVRTTPIPTD